MTHVFSDPFKSHVAEAEEQLRDLDRIGAAGFGPRQMIDKMIANLLDMNVYGPGGPQRRVWKQFYGFYDNEVADVARDLRRTVVSLQDTVNSRAPIEYDDWGDIVDNTTQLGRVAISGLMDAIVELDPPHCTVGVSSEIYTHGNVQIATDEQREALIELNDA